MSNDRARISILSTLFSFPTISGKDWEYSIGDSNPIKGDLVSMSSAPDSKYYLSWYRGSKVEYKERHHLLESIEDGELCWWCNIGLNIYSRERVKERPTWQWNDKQFAFNDRWNKACRRNDAYIVLPMLPIFNENKVTLNIRTKFNLGNINNPCNFENWNKLTIKEMEKYYLDSVKLYKSKNLRGES